MAKTRTSGVQRDATPDAPLHPDAPTPDRVRDPRRGGQELPDEAQDRPEQNAGYDAAVAGETASTPVEAVDDMAIDPTSTGDERGLNVRDVPDPLEGERPPEPADDRATREAVAEVRRRERRR
jgi:hypothetical protein